MHQGSLTGHMASQGNAPQQNECAHECHYFAQNTVAQQESLMRNLGPRVHVGGYDTPHFNVEAPLGTSIFQLYKEREFAE